MRRALAFVLACSMLQAAPAVAEPPTVADLTGRFLEGVQCQVDPSQTYTLYLPSSYTTERTWPALLVLDPRGRSRLAAERFREAAEKYGWILMSSNDTASDGPMEINMRALKALWPEIHARVASDPKRIYAAGFSGTATVAWLLSNMTGELAGVIGVGQPYRPELMNEGVPAAYFGAVGDADFNFLSMHGIDDLLAERGVPRRLEVFSGRHTWLPEELATEAIEWLELTAMRRGTRERDAGLIERLLARDLARAAALEAAGEGLSARRRYEAIGRTFEGLADVTAAAASAARLAASEEVRKAEKEERRWDLYAEQYLHRLAAALTRLERGEERLSTARLAAELELEHLKRRAEEGSYAGATARRLLESVYVRTSFYLPRELLEQRAYAPAATALEVAVGIYQDRPDVWYNLACARARLGDEKGAVEALERAVDTGWNNREHLLGDPDLASLREREDFRQVVGRLGSGAP